MLFNHNLLSSLFQNHLAGYCETHTIIDSSHAAMHVNLRVWYRNVAYRPFLRNAISQHNV